MPATITNHEIRIDDPLYCPHCWTGEHVLFDENIEHTDDWFGTTKTVGYINVCTACGARCTVEVNDDQGTEHVAWHKACAYCGETERRIWEDYEAGEPCSACRDVLRGALKLMREVRA